MKMLILLGLLFTGTAMAQDSQAFVSSWDLKCTGVNPASLEIREPHNTILRNVELPLEELEKIELVNNDFCDKQLLIDIIEDSRTTFGYVPGDIHVTTEVTTRRLSSSRVKKTTTTKVQVKLYALNRIFEFNGSTSVDTFSADEF